MKRNKRGGSKQISAPAPASSNSNGTNTAASSPLPSTFPSFDFTNASTRLSTPPHFPLEDGESSAASLPGSQSLSATEGDRARSPNASPVDDVASQFMVTTSDAGHSGALVMSDAFPPGNPPETTDLQGGGDQGVWQSFLGGGSAPSLSDYHVTGFRGSSSSSSGSSSSGDFLLDGSFSLQGGTGFSICPPLGEGLPDQPRATLTDNSGFGNAFDLTLTCQRGSLRTVAYHLVDAAMLEIKRRAVQEDQVTLTLRLSTG